VPGCALHWHYQCNGREARRRSNQTSTSTGAGPVVARPCCNSTILPTSVPGRNGLRAPGPSAPPPNCRRCGPGSNGCQQTDYKQGKHVDTGETTRQQSRIRQHHNRDHGWSRRHRDKTQYFQNVMPRHRDTVYSVCTAAVKRDWNSVRPLHPDHHRGCGGYAHRALGKKGNHLDRSTAVDDGIYSKPAMEDRPPSAAGPASQLLYTPIRE
jgi:hypothetical protein